MKTIFEEIIIDHENMMTIKKCFLLSSTFCLLCQIICISNFNQFKLDFAIISRITSVHYHLSVIYVIGST